MTSLTRIKDRQKPKNVVRVFAVSGVSPLILSRALTQLTITHLVTGYSESDFRYTTRRIKAPCLNPPAMPVLCCGLASVRYVRSKYERNVYFVCDSSERLSFTNLEPLPGAPDDLLTERLKTALLMPWLSDVVIVHDEPGMLDYIDKASRPSILRELQTAFYRVTPYDLRKKFQAAIFRYLSAGMSRTALNAVLARHIRGEDVARLLSAPAAQILIQALREVERGEDPQKTADRHGLDVFDINYVRASVQKELKNGKASDTSNARRPRRGRRS